MRRALLFVLVFALVPAGAAIAADGFLKVTGGGQVLFDDQTTGPGDTIAFNAQQISQTETQEGFQAKGQLQVIQRGEDGNVKFHGRVTCIRDIGTPDDGAVRFGGVQTLPKSEAGTPFTVDATDNGEGATATGEDMIAFRRRDSDQEPCSDPPSGTDLRTTRLARGNVQNHQ